MSAKEITWTTTDLMSRKDAAAYLGVTTVTLWRWVRDGTLPVMRVGGHVLFAKKELDRLKNERK